MRNINIVRVIMRALKKFNDPYYQGSPAEIGFYFIFSVIPMLTIMLQLLSYFDITNQIMDKVMQSFADNSAVISVISAVHSALSSRFSFMFAILALWSASKIEFSLIRISNYTYGIADTNTILGYFKDRFRAIITVAALILLIGGSLLILVYGQTLFLTIKNMLEEYIDLHIHADWLFNILRWPITLVIYILFLLINYRMLPHRECKLIELLPGSLFASAGILISTILYFIYFRYYSNIDLVYGSLTAIIVLLLWFFWIGYILVLGSILNASWYEERYDMEF